MEALLPPAVPSNGTRVPAATRRSDDEEDGPSLSDLTTAYWRLKTAINELRSRAQLPAFRTDERMQVESARKLKEMNAELLDMENYSKGKGTWGRVLAGRPTTRVQRPSSGLTGRPSTRSPVRAVAEYTFGKVETGSSWRDRQVDALFAPSALEREAVPGGRVIQGRQWKSELLHTRAMGSLLAEYSNFDAGSFRDSHHQSGARRTFTKLVWAGLALGLEAFGIGVSRRVLAGDVPFDFMPARADAEWMREGSTESEE